MDKVKVFVDFQKVNLDRFLTKNNREILENYNLLYILKSKSENDIFKIGKSFGVKRLAEYLFYLGNVSNSNQCSGVELYYLAGVRKRLYTNPMNSIISRKEAQLKQDLKQYLVRGTERFRATETQIKRVLEKKGFKTDKQEEETKETEIKKDDKVIKIKGHQVQKNGKVRKFLLEWNRPFKNDVNETLEDIKRIRNLPRSTNAMNKLRQYIKKNKLIVDI